MLRHPLAAGSRFGASLALSLAAALVFASASPAAAPPPVPAELPAPGPLFDPEDIHVNPQHLTVALIGSTFIPQLGPVSAAAILRAGDKVNAWSLEGVMTGLYSRRSAGAATLVLNGFAGDAAPLLALATLQHGEHLNCWLLIDTDRFRPLDKRDLNVVRDGKGIYAGNVEALVYARALVQAYYTSPQAFARAADRTLTFMHLVEEPDRHRGTVVHVEGRLLRIVQHPPLHDTGEAGVGDYYEAWIFNEQFGTNPFVVIVPAWTPGLSRDLLGKGKIEKPIHVSVDGYFFKKFRYQSRDRDRSERETPLVIGHSLTLLGREVPTGAAVSGWVSNLLYGFMGMLAMVVGLAVGLTWWYRRSDNAVRRRVLSHRPEFALPPPDVPPIAAPVAPPVKAGNGAHYQPPHQPRIIFPAGSGERGGKPEEGDPGNKDKDPDEGAGA